MKLATAVFSFHDLQEGVFRKAEGTFLCNDERGEYLAGLGLVWLKDAPEEKPKKRASSTKKK